ncbi:MAG: CPBP family intramembrane metalloprotease [Paludibacter sp.]|nr:CPBP family intramembrane metalloprotease [Paludibacter sp.]MDD4199491.1 CPBP family intramembrane metalloprotease [Paludibacter sp.]MDD4428260.1 CPBP family intramembrane metalloprotease [Paludibacter sp.]
MKKINQTTLFLILTFTISFVLAGIYKLSGGGNHDRTGFMIFGMVYMFIPTISVLIVKKLIHREKIASDLLISFKINKWFFVAWLLMPILAFLTFGISLLFPDVIYSPDMSGMFSRFESMMSPEQAEQMRASVESLPLHLVWITLMQGLIAGITINAIAGFGEELGWRGFMLKQFKEMSFVKASILIGFIWGVWHAPLILMGHNYPQHPVVGVFMMTLWCILLTPIFLYITIKSKSVIAAAIIHGTLNGTFGISIMLIEGGNDLTVGMPGLAGFIALIIAIAVLFVFDRYISKDKIITTSMAEHI